MKRRRADKELVGLLEWMLSAARRGELSGLWTVYVTREGYGCAYLTQDLGDMLVQVRTEIIRTQTQLNSDEVVRRVH